MAVARRGQHVTPQLSRKPSDWLETCCAGLTERQQLALALKESAAGLKGATSMDTSEVSLVSKPSSLSGWLDLQMLGTATFLHCSACFAWGIAGWSASRQSPSLREFLEKMKTPAWLVHGFWHLPHLAFPGPGSSVAVHAGRHRFLTWQLTVEPILGNH